MTPEEITKELEKKLDRKLIATREGSGGMSLSYIEGHAAITQANRIFGFGGWSTDILEGPTLQAAGTKQMYTVKVVVQVQVGDTKASYTDVGSQLVQFDHETAFKGCVIDAEKRALRHLGEQFGNSLYDKHELAEIAKESRTPAPAANGSTAGLPAEVAGSGATVAERPGAKEDCPICRENTITPKIRSYSRNIYGTVACFDCQRKFDEGLLTVNAETGEVTEIPFQ